MLLRLDWKKLKACLDLLPIDKEKKNRVEKDQKMLRIGSQELLTLEEAAFYIGCSQEILLQEVALGKITRGKLGEKWYFHTYSLQEYFTQTNRVNYQSFKVNIGGEELLSANQKLVREFKENVANGHRDFEGINLIGANISHLILINMDLDKALLVNVDLQGSNLYDSLMRSAYLMKANLQCANLSHVDLQSADLSGANLTNANLTNANLTNANLRGAKLTNINLRGAILKGTIF